MQMKSGESLQRNYLKQVPTFAVQLGHHLLPGCCHVVHWEHLHARRQSHAGNISTEKAVTLGTSLQRRQSRGNISTVKAVTWQHLYSEGSHAGNISTEKAVTLGTSLQRVSNLVFYAQSTITVISGCSAKRRQSH